MAALASGRHDLHRARTEEDGGHLYLHLYGRRGGDNGAEEDGDCLHLHLYSRRG
ncbi:hypothetical protein U1Q18_005915, partial [Sarracenia purpurea var. burkii]